MSLEKGKFTSDLLQRASAVRLLVLDVDGVLTTGEIVYDTVGNQIQSFHVHDGFGIKLLERAGIQTAIISARRSAALTKRSEELGIKHVFQGEGDKLSTFNALLQKLQFDRSQTAYMGDDWVDIPVMKASGLAVAVANARDEVKQNSHLITCLPGGKGAVREVCELILTASGKLKQSLQPFLTV